jgi:hypothetical protein
LVVWRTLKLMKKRMQFGSTIVSQNSSTRVNTFVHLTKGGNETFTPYRCQWKRPRIENKPLVIENILGSNEHSHIWIENINQVDSNCYFCLFRVIKKNAANLRRFSMSNAVTNIIVNEY